MLVSTLMICFQAILELKLCAEGCSQTCIYIVRPRQRIAQCQVGVDYLNRIVRYLKELGWKLALIHLTSDDSWTPLRLPGACALGVGNFHLASGKINDDLKPVHSPPWSANIGTTAFTQPGSLDSSFYYTQDENKMLVEHPLSTRRVPSVRPPSTCTSVSSTPLSASVLNQHQSDLYSGSEAQQASSVNFQSQVTGPASSSDPTSCPKARPRASGPRVKAACTTCK
jgi:hypothetical protein